MVHGCFKNHFEGQTRIIIIAFLSLIVLKINIDKSEYFFLSLMRCVFFRWSMRHLFQIRWKS